MKEAERYWVPEGSLNWIKTQKVYVKQWGWVDFYMNIYGSIRYLYFGKRKYEWIGYNADGKAIPKKDEKIIDGSAYKLVETKKDKKYYVEGEGYMTDEEWLDEIKNVSNRTMDLIECIQDEKLAQSMKQLVLSLVKLVNAGRNETKH